MTKASTPTENPQKQRDNTHTPSKTSITQLLRTDLGRSVGVTIATQLVWLNRFTGSQPSHLPQMLRKAPVRHTLQPLCDLSATDNLHQSQRSQQGPRSVPARLQRSRRLIGDLVATKSVAARFLCLHKNLAATDLVADRSRQSRRPVPDQSPTDRRLILSESGRGYHWN